MSILKMKGSGRPGTFFLLSLFLANPPVWAEQESTPEPMASTPASTATTEQAVQVEVPASPPVPPSGPPQTVWIDDDLPPEAQPEGTWIWEEEQKTGGTRSHGHPPQKGMHSHAFTASPQKLALTGRILQQVWLDPQDPPLGIALRFRRPDGEEVGVYWEGEQEVFTPGEYEEMWYYGLLPELGKWTGLEILAEDLGLEGKEVTGIRFMTHGGRVLWDETILTEIPTEEGTAGPSAFPTPTLPDLGRDEPTP